MVQSKKSFGFWLYRFNQSTRRNKGQKNIDRRIMHIRVFETSMVWSQINGRDTNLAALIVSARKLILFTSIPCACAWGRQKERERERRVQSIKSYKSRNIKKSSSNVVAAMHTKFDSLACRRPKDTAEKIYRKEVDGDIMDEDIDVDRFKCVGTLMGNVGHPKLLSPHSFECIRLWTFIWIKAQSTARWPHRKAMHKLWILSSIFFFMIFIWKCGHRRKRGNGSTHVPIQQKCNKEKLPQLCSPFYVPFSAHWIPGSGF